MRYPNQGAERIQAANRPHLFGNKIDDNQLYLIKLIYSDMKNVKNIVKNIVSHVKNIKKNIIKNIMKRKKINKFI